MKICIACDVLGEPNNGTSLASYNLINHLRSKGHTVHILCCDRLKDGEPDYFILKPWNFGTIINGYIASNGISVGKVDYETLDRACRDVDLIHCMLPFSVGKAAAIYGYRHNIPVTCGFHCQAENITSHFFLMNVRVANNQAYHILWDRMYQFADAIHCPTQFISDYIDKYGYDKVPHYIISNGVQTDLFYPQNVARKAYLNNKFVIIMTGRLSREKRQKKLIKAVAKSKYKDKIQIVFCGDGPLRYKLLKYGYKKLPHCPIIRCFPHNELNQILCQGDLYVHTSTAEIEAISCLEALACGLVPVISDSKRSATSKFALHPNNSFNSHSRKDLTGKIDYWIEHPEEKARLSQEYADFAKTFDFNKCMDDMENMLKEVIAKGKIDKPWIKNKKLRQYK